MSSTLIWQRRLQRLERSVRRRHWLRTLVFGLPLLLLLGALLARSALSDGWIGLILGGSALMLSVLAVAMAHRRHHLRQLLLQLDHQLPQLQDSAALLLSTAQTPLQQLQQARILAALEQSSPRWPALLPSWRWPALLLVWLLAAAMIALLLHWPAPTAGPLLPMAAGTAPPDQILTHTEVAAVRVRITPPKYTGLPATQQNGLEVRAAQGSTLLFELSLEPQPQAVMLEFVDGQSLPLRLEDGSWRGQFQLEQPSLYRLGVDASASPLRERSLHTLAVIPDMPPQLTVLAPQLSLSRHQPGQQHWPLRMQARDDHGLGQAELVLTRTQGTGEQVSVSEQRILLRGVGDARQRDYQHQVDLHALGLAEGDDLIARFEVQDQRQPQPQRSSSSSYILRWPAPLMAEASGVEGLVNTTLPAYFRSQRQIIIDTEALLAQTPVPAESEFAERSDVIGVDQRLLRLRYGQFLGEEFEPPPAPAESSADSAADDHAGHGHDHGHEHAATAASPAASVFGDAGTVQAEYGHVHDIPEAATLLDPATRKLLKEALDQMWQAELYLRSARPREALPYEYRALELVKQVQQGSRIYLARVGLELPPIDFGRRLSGDRSGLRPRADPLDPQSAEPDPVAQTWRLLDLRQLATNDTATIVQLQQALPTLIEHLNSASMDPDQRLALLATIDAVSQDQQCQPCLEALRRGLWPLQRIPPAMVAPRAGPDSAARAYLQALEPQQPL